jgi:isocitrate dehydrogenase (NADP) (EC 1.1.1.42)
MAYKIIQVPPEGEKIIFRDGKLQVPDHPILPFIEGDGTGRDIWRASVRVFDAAVQKAYGGRRKVGYRARIRNHGHSCFLCEIVIRSQFHTTYEPEA